MRIWRRIDWSRPLVRRSAAVVVFAAALLLQYFLANVPVPRELGDDARLSTVRAALAQQALVLRDYTARSEDGTLLSYAGNDREIVSLDFERARLGGNTARAFHALGLRPPGGPGKLHYFTQEAEPAPRGQSCRTFLEVKAAGSAAAPELVLYQLGSPGLRRQRRIEIQSSGAPLLVRVHTALPEDQRDGPGCRKALAAGDWIKQVRAMPLEIEVAPGSAFRVSFHPAEQGAASWDGTQGFFDSLLLDTLAARELSVQPLAADGKPDGGSAPLELRSFGAAPLRLKSLRLGSESIELSVTGRAWVRRDGRPAGVDLIALLSASPTLAYLLGAANLALIELLRRLFFKSRPAAVPQTT